MTRRSHMDHPTLLKRLIEMGLTTEKVAELLKDESGAAKEYGIFAEKLRRLSREADQPEMVKKLRDMSDDFNGMAHDELHHHKLLGDMNGDIPSESCDIPGAAKA